MVIFFNLVFKILAFLIMLFGETVIKVFEQLSFCHFAPAYFASKIGPAFMRVKVLFLVGDLVESLVAAIDWALEGLFTSVGP